MKNYMYILLLATNLTVNSAFCQTTDTYFATIQKVTTLMQELSGKLIAESVNPTTRSSNGLDTNYYYKKMIEGLEEEVAAIIGNKNNEDLSQEEKDTIQI